MISHKTAMKLKEEEIKLKLYVLEQLLKKEKLGIKNGS